MNSFQGKAKAVDEAISGPIVEKAYGLGTVHSLDTFRFRVAVPTKVTKVFVLEGDEVSPGQVLLQLEGLTPVRSPIRGIVSEIGYHEGEVAFQSFNAVEVLGTGSKYLLVALDEQILLSIRKGQKALVRFEGKPDESVLGVVRGTFSNSGQFFARIETERFPDGVLPGMTADVAIEVGKKENAVLVPRKYEKQHKIRIFRNGKSFPITFTPGLKSEHYVEVKDGDVRPGDKLTEVR
ncbi:secretion protein HlyD [Leptospira gomenensis]|uniref:efflux RND transporter periplasmic adaptor subunit n=1 Tax=Leptospira gomenensis TaxID=2484974 RepID=UPI0010838449|nr:biotin/lipoyl-binding protein [Leptospira gomenensis]TGK54687.1 secretion protein HlyD [Leptospira gomenensis]